MFQNYSTLLDPLLDAHSNCVENLFSLFGKIDLKTIVNILPSCLLCVSRTGTKKGTDLPQFSNTVLSVMLSSAQRGHRHRI